MQHIPNPISADWFQFPDLASFPDYADEDRNTNEEIDNLHVLRQCLASDNAAGFVDVIKYYTGNVPWLTKVGQQFNAYRRGARGVANTCDNACANDLYENGIHVTNIDMSGLETALLVDSLLQQPDWSPPPGKYDRGDFLPATDCELIQEKFALAGIMEGIRRYSGRERRVTAVFLHVSKPTDKHYKQFFMDAETTPRWTNLHIDPKEDVIKSVIYLNEVGANNGGFGYVPKSHRFRHDPVQEILGRTITTGNYCRTPEERASVFALPASLRVSYNFGRCVMDDSELATSLDAHFQRVTSDMGNVSVFDAGAGMHQGGLVQEGQRISLQVLMK